MRYFVVLAAVSATLMAANLQEKAKESGLQSIPTSKKALMKLIDNPKNPITKDKVSLGEKLFFDPRLSKSGFISCNSCHNLSMGGDDGVEAAIGHGWAKNPHHLNSPTVLNAVFFESQFWDGRSPHVEDQAQGPMQAAPEMASSKEHVANTVNSIPEYVAAFKKAYGKDVKISFEKVADTIATFERTLVTPSRFDAFLDGKKNALTKDEKKGLELFINKGCTECHTGVALGGAMQSFNRTGTYKFNNVGDFRGNKDGLVKVPTLRNITQTAPYFHNGKIWSLKEAIQEMGRIQIGLEITDAEAQSIATFFKALEGEVKLRLPQLPNSTATTPLPEN